MMFTTAVVEGVDVLSTITSMRVASPDSAEFDQNSSLCFAATIRFAERTFRVLLGLS